jgi:hypothetical protein
MVTGWKVAPAGLARGMFSSLEGSYDRFIQQLILYAGLLSHFVHRGVTATGASLVFMSREINPKLLDGMFGFADGVMIAASFWSLLAPGSEMAEQFRFCHHGYPGGFRDHDDS